MAGPNVYQTNHPNPIVAVLEGMRKTNQMSVARHCNVTRLNQRTYEAWLSGARAPQADSIRWIAVAHRETNEVIGVMRDFEPYVLSNANRERYYTVMYDGTGDRLDFGDGPEPHIALMNGAFKASGMIGASYDDYAIQFRSDLLSALCR
jgi:hypothetical protein